jgi:hypothetical protein
MGYSGVRHDCLCFTPTPRLTLSLSSVEVKDISLTDYIQIRHAVYLPHTAGRYAKKQFKKAQMPIVERLVDRLVKVSLFHRPVSYIRYQSNDEGPQQWQETFGSPHCCTRIRDYPPPHRSEPNPGEAACLAFMFVSSTCSKNLGSCRCHCQHWSS